MRYDKQFFIDKLEAIPEERWCTGLLIDADDRRCVVGHCMEISIDIETGQYDATQTVETHALGRLFSTSTEGRHMVAVTLINDGKDPTHQQPTPKQRVLAALRDLP